MRLGTSVPQFGSISGAASVRAVAERAEALGYDSLWVGDRLIGPVAPKAPYPGTADGSLPDGFRRALDPTGVLTFAAACTRRVRLGMSVLVLPLYNPVILARELTTLDVLSEGRLSLGIGTGWLPDEYDAAGVDMKTRGARIEEAMDVLRKYWTEETPEHKGAFYTLPKCEVLRPVQRPGPPLYLSAYKPGPLRRVAERADGWNPGALPIPVMQAMWGGILGMAKEAGRDPAALELVVRANVVILPSAPAGDRHPFIGTEEQIRADIQALRDIGAHELLLDPQFDPSVTTVEQYLEIIEQLHHLAR